MHWRHIFHAGNFLEFLFSEIIEDRFLITIEKFLALTLGRDLTGILQDASFFAEHQTERRDALQLFVNLIFSI